MRHDRARARRALPGRGGHACRGATVAAAGRAAIAAEGPARTTLAAARAAHAGAARARAAGGAVQHAAGDAHGTRPLRAGQADAGGAPAPERVKPAAPGNGSVTGLPLPRWASLRSDDVNLRAGPGTRYPVDWVYRRRDLPVEIEREFEVWRLVRDQDGVRGWVHAATLTGRRDFVVSGGEHTMRSSAADTASAVAMLKPGVVGRIRDC